MNMRKSLGMFFGVLLGIIFGSTSISAFSTSEPGVGLLYKAIEIGEMEKAKELLAGIDVNTQDFLGYTPLYKAVFYNRKKLVEYLFRYGADVNLADVEGLAPRFSVEPAGRRSGMTAPPAADSERPARATSA